MAPRGVSVTTTRMAVDVKVQDMPNSVKKLAITVTADECQNAFQAVLAKLTKQVRLLALGSAPYCGFPAY